MASINYAYKEIISKIVYYGPGLSGKTTNLQYVFSKVPAETRGELISLATDADRTLYFDFLPLNVGTIKGFATKFQLYTVPGQVYYNATRKLVLRGVDGIVFVADSQAEKIDENLESFQNLQDNLAEYGYDIDNIPTVIQYNKRDLPNAMEIAELERILNKKGFQHFEAVAPTGEGVFKTLKMISKMVLEEIRKNKMGAPNAVKPQKPKQEAVAVSVSSAPPSEKTVEKKPTPTAIAPTNIEENSLTPPADTEEETGSAADDQEDDISKRKVPGIVEDSDTLANVVVSDSQHLPSTEDEESENDLEETTERAVLRDEPPLENREMTLHDDVGQERDLADDDLVGRSQKARGPMYDIPRGRRDFDEEQTQISDLNLRNPLPLGKPQMAESRKVKNKNRKFGFLGLFKKSKK